MKSFTTSTIINATPEAVWEVLTDAEYWPDWNPTMDRVEGTIADGETIALFTKEYSEHALRVRISNFDPPRRMVWTGGMRWGLYVGERTYTLEPVGDGDTEFTMRVVYKGLLALFFQRSLPDMQPTFDEFAAALKEYCEDDEGDEDEE